MNSISLRLLPLLVFSLVFVLLPSSSSSSSSVEVCENGTYLPRRSSGISPDVAMTTSAPPLSTASYCTRCNDTVPFCYNCRVSENASTAVEVDCTECFVGYQPTHELRNCSIVGRHSPEGGNNRFVGLVVGVVVGGVVVVVGLVILVVCLVRRGACSTTAFRSTTPPPSLPDPEHLANSYKENQQHSGSGQRRDHRYAKEPGATSPRVESVQYDGLKVEIRNESSPYVNCSGVTSTANKKRTTKEEEEEEEEEEEDDDVYVNSPTQQVPSSGRSKVNPSHRGPGPVKPKPKGRQRGDQTQSHGQTQAPKSSVLEKRESVFPPDDPPEQVYSNEPDSENEEDYVNADVTQMRAGR